MNYDDLIEMIKNEFENPKQAQENFLNKIKGFGGKLYQYRSCRKSDDTIYDLKTLEEKSIFLNSPLKFNDPFDSLLSLNPDEIYVYLMDKIIDKVCRQKKLSKEYETIIQLIFINSEKGLLEKFIAGYKTFFDRMKKIYNKQYKNKEKTFKSFLKNKAPNCKENIQAYFKANNWEFFEINFYCIIEMNKQKKQSISDFLLLLEETNEKMKKIMHGIKAFVPNLKENYCDVTNKFVISCFTTKWNNQLMWSHYASNYSGICIEYDLEKFVKNNPGVYHFLFPVIYQERRPSLELKDFNLTITDDLKEIKFGDTDNVSLLAKLYSKNICWSYEEEWRLINIHNEKTPFEVMGFDCVSGLYFGRNINRDLRNHLLLWAYENNVKCFDIIPDDKEYQLNKVEVIINKNTIDLDMENEFIKEIYGNFGKKYEEFEKVNKEISERATNGDISILSYSVYSRFMDGIIESIKMLSVSVNTYDAYINYSNYMQYDLSIEDFVGGIKTLLIFEETCKSINKIYFREFINKRINESQYKELMYKLSVIERLIKKTNNEWNSSNIRRIVEEKEISVK